ncbi:MAG: superinfection immunity protein [Geobacteraceae bacterium]|nr:superinfection immunity protein [Geobacteraceae bacterium]
MKKVIMVATLIQSSLLTQSFALAAGNGSNGSAGVGIVIALIFCIGFYFLPTMIGFSRKKENKIAILLLNLFLGWSLVGWVVALVWAVSKDKNYQVVVTNAANNVNN